jgi:hypothetical protein
MEWFFNSNRYKHFGFALFFSALFSVFFGLGLGTGMEYKDYMYKDEWDWLDWGCTAIGSLIGGIFNFVIVYNLLQ